LTVSPGVGADIAVDIALPAAPAAGAAEGYTDAEKAGIVKASADAILAALNVAASPFTVAYSGTATVLGELTLQYKDTYKLEPDATAASPVPTATCSEAHLFSCLKSPYRGRGCSKDWRCGSDCCWCRKPIKLAAE